MLGVIGRILVVAALLGASGDVQNLQEPPPTPNFSTGLLFSPPDEYKRLPLAGTPLMGVLPKAVDLSVSFPEPHSTGQGQQGSCVGWAVAYALKSHMEKVERKWDFGETTVFSPSYVYNVAKEPGDCKVGTYLTKALKYVQENGVARWSDFGYDESSCTRLPTPEMRQRALPFRILSYATANPSDVAELKSHLAVNEPVIIGMWVDPDFQRLCSGCVYQGIRSDPLGGHAVVVVGYDDQKGAFKIYNSWGSKWATKGYGWISYTAFSDTTPRTVIEAYVAQDVTEPLTLTSTDAAPSRKVSFEVVHRRFEPVGTKSVTVTTEDRHCSRNCEGEPTRKNYSTSLSADPGLMLNNPRLVCHGASCPWSGVLYVRLEQANQRAVGSWDVWSRPMTWELTAEQRRIVEVRREPNAVEAGTEFEIPGEENGPPPVIVWTDEAGARHRYEPGGDLPAGLSYLGRREVGGVPTFRFRFTR